MTALIRHPALVVVHAVSLARRPAREAIQFAPLQAGRIEQVRCIDVLHGSGQEVASLWVAENVAAAEA